MPSVTDIANRALDRLGQEPLTDIQTDNNVNSRLLNRMFAIVRDAETRKHYWKFAKARVILAPLVSVPDFDWAYEYQLPSDFLRVFSVNEFTGPDYQVPYEVQGKKLLTDAGTSIQLKYIKQVTDPNLFDALFVEVLGCQLAFQACEKITQSNTKKKAMYDEYMDLIKAAKRADALEEPPEDMPEGSWLTSMHS